MSARRLRVAGLASGLALVAIAGCANLVGANFSDKVECTDNCPGDVPAPSADDASDAVAQAPVTLIAFGQDSPDGVAVDGEYIYWLNQGSDSASGALLRCPLSGCGAAPTVLASNLSTPTAMITDAANVYWTQNGPDGDTGRVMSCAKAGCNGSPTVIADMRPDVASAMALDADRIYWTEDADSEVLSCPIAGCQGAPTVLASNQDLPAGIAVDGTNVYFAIQDQIVLCPKSGCPADPTLLADRVLRARSVVVDGASLYWSDANGDLAACAISGCDDQPSSMVTDAYGDNFVVDGANLYWIDDDDGVWTCAVSDCMTSARQVASEQRDPSWLAIDSTDVYWSSEGSEMDGQISKTLK